MKKVGELLKDVRIAMLTTVADDGSLRSRPMGTQAGEFTGELWFFTSDDSGKVSEIGREHQVGLSYANPEKNSYVSITGTAQVIHDRAKAKELWTPLLKAWFPQGLDDPKLALLRVDVQSADYWDSPSSKMVSLYRLAKAAVTGNPRDAAKLGEHGHVAVH